MNILKNIWIWVTAKLAFKKNEVVDSAEVKVEQAKTFVRDEKGRFAAKAAEVKAVVETPFAEVKAYAEQHINAVKAATQEAADTAMAELTQEEQKQVAGGDLPRGGITSGEGPHGSW